VGRADGIHWRTGGAPGDREGADDPIRQVLSDDSPTVMDEPEARWHWASVAAVRPDALTFWRSSPQKSPADRFYNAHDFSRDVFYNIDDHYHRTGVYPKDVILLNELNLNYERGDNASDVDAALWPARYAQLGGFLSSLVDECRARAADRGAAIRWWFPGWSPGHGEAENLASWLPAALKYDGVCLHGYGTEEWITQQILWYAGTFPDHPLVLGEWNPDTYDGPRVPMELQTRPRLQRICDAIERLHCCYFIHHWGDSGDPRYDIEGVDERRAIWDGRTPLPADDWVPPVGVTVGPAPQPAPEPPPPQQPDPEVPVPTILTMPAGADVSNNNGRIDWPVAAAAGLSFAIAKVTEGRTFVDGWFDYNWAQMRAAGLVRGAYHFGRPSLYGALDEAHHFLDSIAHLVGELQPGDLLALDLEDPDVATYQDLSVWTLTWLQEVERLAGFKPLLYTSPGYAEQHQLASQPLIGEYGLWCASWRSTLPSPPAPWSVIALWQNAVLSGYPGFSGEVDHDSYNGDITTLPLYGKPSAAPAPVPVPTPPDAGYNVGSGLLEAMTAHHDAPITNEEFPNDSWSEAMGGSGRTYRWVKSTGRAYIYAPESD
jgi:GH25 family lysozyme M1 (1,4-beta-N-acetylmuramidase)